MSDTSANLDLPYILPAQAQKHVTHNEAIRALDAVVQLSVLDRDLAAPPADPAEGDRHIVAPGASGDWSGKDGAVAAFQDAAWAFYPPAIGWVAWLVDEARLVVWDGAAWDDAAGASGGVNPAPLVGVNATADETNKLAVASDAALFNHAGADHRLKINKAGAGATASVLFQSGFSGRAEIGLAGDDDFRFKVAADGATWRDAIIIDSATGSVTLPHSSIGGGGVPAGGAPGEILMKSSAADFDLQWAPTPSAASGPPDLMHTDGLVAEWRFDEGAGERARDLRGGRDIVFDAAFQTAYSASPEWTRRGLRVELGVVQTPTIPGARTVAFLCRQKRGLSSGFILSGGASSGHGVLADTANPAWGHHVGGGQGVAPLAFRQSSGQAAHRLNRGGWQILFIEFDQAFTTPLGFGGRHTFDTTSPVYRLEEFEIAWAGVWNDALTDPERRQVYDAVRALTAPRGLLVDWRDAPATYDCALLWGQSNAEGRAPFADLSAADQARAPARHVLIAPANDREAGANYASPEPFVLGDNQQMSAPSSDFGPELGAAWRREDADTTRVRPLVVNKFAIPATFMAPSTTGVGANVSWHPDELPTHGIFHAALSHWWDTEQRLLAQGVGPRLRALWWMQGEEDALSTAYSSAYGAGLQALWNAVKTYTGYDAGVRMLVGRTGALDPAADAAAIAEVRQAQADFAAVNADADIIDTDGFSRQADQVHFDAQGAIALGEAFYDGSGF
ncbi:MAG: DUF2793 domain-containing protein [Pseudomonadota bacterium]